MANEGEIEVFRISPEVGKCYEHIEATREEYFGHGKFRYFTTNTPRYVGKFIRQERKGHGDGVEVTGIFDNGRVNYSYGFTCFTEVPCRELEETKPEVKKSWFQRVFRAKGGYRKRKTKRLTKRLTNRKTTKLKSKSKKSRK